MIVDYSGEQIMCCTDCMKVAGEMQINVRHRNHLGFAAPCSAPLHPKTGPQAGLTQADQGFLAQFAQAVTQADGRGCFTFTRGRR